MGLGRSRTKLFVLATKILSCFNSKLHLRRSSIFRDHPELKHSHDTGPLIDAPACAG